MEDPAACEEDEELRMPILSDDERRSMDFTCFEACLTNPSINSDQVHRVVLLGKEVHDWCLTSDAASVSNFVNVLEGLKPAAVRRAGVKQTTIHRRAIVGTATTYEVLAAPFQEPTQCDKVAIFTPFVSGEADGFSRIGILVWAISTDAQASMYKTLISNTDFMRHKVEMNDRFLPHKASVLQLGRDMHLLDLHSTSIWTTSTMDLYVLEVDKGDLDRERIQCSTFSARKRIVYSEELGE